MSSRSIAIFLVALLTTATNAACDGAADEGGDVESGESALASSLAIGTRLRTTARVNLRRGPSTSDSIIRTLAIDTEVITVNRTTPSGAFYNVSANGIGEGWVHGAFLRLAAPGTSEPSPPAPGGPVPPPSIATPAPGSPPASVCPSVATGRVIIVGPGQEALTIQDGLNRAAPGDTINVRPGIYRESVTFPSSGTSTAGCITLKGEPGAILDGSTAAGAGARTVGISIAGKRYVSVTGMTIRNYRTGDTPTGISVRGASNHVEVRNNLVHNIESSSDAHGMAFYGDASTPMSDLLIDGNEIRNCKLGSSESMVVNGNVTGFVVSRNRVHDNDNIGIDFIGFEGIGPSGSDQARNGVCVDNIVTKISSASNPAYNGERSADGIYVDGGRDIVIERNQVDQSDIGIEIASEHGGRTTSNITVRNNFVARSYQGNVMMGGYDANRGNAENIVVIGNTLYQAKSGEIIVQHNSKTITIKNNICYGSPGKSYIASTGGNNTAVAVENNLYFGASTTSAGTWTDPRAKFANPLLANAPVDLHILAGSPAINAGLDLGALLLGATDIDGTARIKTTVDIGAHER